jgi:hypothetical protein
MKNNFLSFITSLFGRVSSDSIQAADKDHKISSTKENEVQISIDGYKSDRISTKFIESLDIDQLKELNKLLPWKCFTADSSGRRFGNIAWQAKREIPQVIPDRRIIMMHDRFNLTNKHVLEIGCFEGVHTVGLGRFAGKVTAIDSRVENVVKSMVRTGFFGFHCDIFVCDIENKKDFKFLPKVDYVHHVGVLYHLKDPVTHLRALASLTKRGLMLDTHYAKVDKANYSYRVKGIDYQYQHHPEGGRKEVFSGMYDHAKWLLMDDICAILKEEGFKMIEVKEVRDERNGPRLLLFANR